MATGDRTDILARLKAVLPPWFADSAPLLDGALSGFAAAMALVYELIGFARLQTRIKTATGGWLDLVAFDFFGFRIRRGPGQTDASLRARIVAELFRERATRYGITRVLTELTGRAPIIFEPARPADTGAYGPGPGGDGIARGLAYNTLGGYGSLLLPYQAFVTAYRPSGSGIPNVAGYGVSTGAYGTPSRLEYGSLAQIQGAITDADIFAAVDSVAPVATTLWTRISN